MTFEEIPERMRILSVKRPWLAEVCHYSLSHISNALAPKGNESSKTEATLKRMWEALDREEERQRSLNHTTVDLGQRLFLDPTKEQFDNWMRASYATADGNFDSWAKEGLDAKAAAELPSLLEARKGLPLGEIEPQQLKVAEEPATYSDGKADQSATA